MPTRPGIPRPGADSGRSALVVGAGIGGLGVARALGLAGWQVQVLEQANALDPVGAGITLWPNAVRALDVLGVRIRDYASPPGVGGLRTSSGRWLSRTDTADYPARYGAPLVAVHRADLQQALLGTLPAGTTATGTRVTGITQDATGLSVQHSSGLSRASLVVLADGLASANRHLVTGTAVRPRYAGYTAWRGVTGMGAVPVNQSGTTESWGRGQRFGIVPLAGGRIYWFATANTPEGQHSPDGPRGEHGQVSQRFHGWHAPIAQVLAATPPESVLRHDIYDLQPNPRSYVRGRLAVLGDAAHAMTPNLGQGACQALEDAVTMGALLHPDVDPALALLEYDRVRRPRAQAISSRSRQLGRIGQLSGRTTTAARDALLTITPDSAADHQLKSTLAWPVPTLA